MSSKLFSAFEAALTMNERLPIGVSEIDGMSGQSYRLFINTLLGSMSSARYLEIGSWSGSTVAAAMHGSTATALCIDNWSQFGGPKDQFLENTSDLRLEGRVDLLEEDFRSVDYDAVGKFDVFLYDGPHGEADHHDGILLPQPALRRNYFLVVDDWNWSAVRIGTFRGLAASTSTIQFAIEVRTTEDNEHPDLVGKDSDWHNGCFLAVIAKGA